MTFARSRQNQKGYVTRRSKTLRLYNKASDAVHGPVAKVIDSGKATPDSPSAPVADIRPRPKRSERVLPATTSTPEIFMTDPNVTIKNLAEGRQDVFRVDPDKLAIIWEKGHPLYDERVALPIDEGLVKSIMEHGIRQAVSVRRNGSLFEVMDGRQRVKAALEANKRMKASGKAERILVPVIMAKDNDAQAAKIMVALNEIRTQDSPMVQAAKAKRLLDYGASKQDVANQFGKPISWLHQILKVLDTDDTVQTAVDKGMIAVTAASKLATLPREEQKKAMADLRDQGHGLTRGNIRAKVKAVKAAASTGQAEKAIVTPPKRSVVVAVHDAYEAHVPANIRIDPSLLLRWVLTGMGTEALPSPRGLDVGGSLADWLREYETGTKGAPKAAT